MHEQFWHDRWATNDIGFHNHQTNPLLTRYFNRLDLRPGARIFLPLCGKTVDIDWLLAQGLSVCGCELSERAVDDLFARLRQVPRVQTAGSVKKYSAEHLEIFTGNIFELSAEHLGPVDACYDRAALVALPEPQRLRYTNHLQTLSAAAQQLLITFEYDQATMPGPPFSVSEAELHSHYNSGFMLTHLAAEPVAGGLKGITPAVEKVWWLVPR